MLSSNDDDDDVHIHLNHLHPLLLPSLLRMKKKVKGRLRRLLVSLLLLIAIASLVWAFAPLSFARSGGPALPGSNGAQNKGSSRPKRPSVIQYKVDYHDELLEAAGSPGLLPQPASAGTLKDEPHARAGDDGDGSRTGAPGLRKYLLVTMIGGPNNEIFGFKEGVLLARLLGRVLVLPQFLVHYDLFHEYKVRQVYEFGEMFEGDSLREFVPTISWQEFRNLTRGRVDLWRVRDDEKCLNYEGKFLTSYNMTARSVTMVPGWHRSRPFPYLFNTTQQIAAMFEGRDEPYAVLSCLYNLVFSPSLIKQPLLPEMLQVSRALELNHAYQGIREAVGFQDPYLAIHYRLNEKEDECVKEATSRNAACFGHGKPFYMLDLECFVKDVKERMTTLGLSFVYLATIEQRGLLLRRLQEAGLRVVTMADIHDPLTKYLLKHRRAIGNIWKLRVEAFVYSLAEEQICIDSELFFGSLQSTWTQYVYIHRFTRGLSHPAQPDLFLNGHHCSAFWKKVLHITRNGTEETSAPLKGKKIKDKHLRPWLVPDAVDMPE